MLIKFKITRFFIFNIIFAIRIIILFETFFFIELEFSFNFVFFSELVIPLNVNVVFLTFLSELAFNAIIYLTFSKS